MYAYIAERLPDFSQMSFTPSSLANGLVSAAASAVSMVHTVALRAIHLAGNMPKHTGRFAGMAEKFHSYVVPFLEAAGAQYGWVRSARFIKAFSTEWAIVGSLMEIYRLAHPLREIVTGQFWSGTTTENVEKTLGTAANLCVTAMFLDELEVIDLAKLSESIGNIKVLNVLTKYPLGNIALGLGSTAYVFSVYHAYEDWRTYQGADLDKLHEKRLDLAAAVSDTALYLLLFAGTKSVPVIALAAGVSLTVGLAITDHKKGK